MSKVYIFRTGNPKQIYLHLKTVAPRIDKDTVLIKPNIVIAAKPNSAVVTDFKLVKAIIKYLKEIGVKRIIIGESPGLNVDVELAFKVSGFSRLAQEENIELLNLEKAETLEKTWKFGKIKIPKIL